MRLADPPPLLAGRDDLLAELDTRLTDGDKTTPRKVALYGLGGAGKTSVALAYAHRHLAEVGVAWQFTAQDSTVLAAGFGELADQLDARDLTDPRDPVLSVHAVLATFPAPWLLIFDNAADMASVAAFLPPAGPGQVLITSQNPTWPGQPLNVPMLATDIAAEFLTNRTGDQDRQTAQDLADLLGGLPLALEQAAAYVHAVADTLAGYLALFRHRRAEMLARGEPTGYDKTVATTWALAFDRLQHTEPGAAGLLRLLAFCAPEAVPLRLLLQPRPGLAGRLGENVTNVLLAGRCWRTNWRAVTRSRPCAGIRWSPRPPTGRCRCTGSSRPSPRMRCQSSRPGNGSRLQWHSSMRRSQRTPPCPRTGRRARRCCRTPKLPVT